MSRSCAVRAVLAAVLTAAPGAAALAAAGLSHCAVIDDDARRLQCYDRESGRPAHPAPPPAPPAQTVSREPSLLGSAWGLEPEPGDEVFKLTYHHANYLLFARHSNNVNNRPSSPAYGTVDASEELDATEAKLQLSIKTRVWLSENRRWGLWGAYTQQSQWQVGNTRLSRPFRETDYQPEAILSYRPDVAIGGMRWRVLNFGLNHQSNGRSEPLSRSWNRVYAEFGLEHGNFALLVRPWARIGEPAEKDDNPDITDYYGYGDITAVYRWHEHTFTAMGRGNPGTGKGAVQLTWSTPRLIGRFKGYVQFFSGYGESLIDYNWRQTTIGLGVALSDDL